MMRIGGVAALLVAGALVMVLSEPQPPPRPDIPVARPVVVLPAPALAASAARQLFTATIEVDPLPVDENGVALDPDAPPRVVGIAGRLPGDAVALVRIEGGVTKPLRVGESIDGWRLTELASDAALFARAQERMRVPLPPVQ